MYNEYIFPFNRDIKFISFIFSVHDTKLDFIKTVFITIFGALDIDISRINLHISAGSQREIQK